MSPEQATALIIAITGLVGALAAVFAQLHSTHTLINSRMTQLIDATKLASQLTGQLEGAAAERASSAEAAFVAKQIETPTGKPLPNNPDTDPRWLDARKP